MHTMKTGKKCYCFINVPCKLLLLSFVYAIIFVTEYVGKGTRYEKTKTIFERSYRHCYVVKYNNGLGLFFIRIRADGTMRK